MGVAPLLLLSGFEDRQIGGREMLRSHWPLPALRLALVLVCGWLGHAAAQERALAASNRLTVDEYLKDAGTNLKLVKAGELKIDGRILNCGTRPTVLNPQFESWGGAFPGFVILNMKKLKNLSTPVKLYVYSHECGHQFEGPDETKADLFAIRRGVKSGWLDAQGMEKICAFVSTLKSDGVHPSGPQRCETMRKYYSQLIERGTAQAASAWHR